jgi:NAD(P)-dependent dehydrogenase (short-subunit alcohol dehydrogenase family)
MMKAYIVTGTTRGLGRALIEAILERGDLALSLSSAPPFTSHKHVNVQVDLADTAALPGCLDALLDAVTLNLTERLVLINNAATLAPLMPLERAPADRVESAFGINLTAPAVLITHFLARTEKLTLARRIINISSGAANAPYAGWACYCGTKAGLEMLTRCVAEEQNRRPNPASISAVAPGVMDTEMQGQIRQAAADYFPQREKFMRLHQEGVLSDPLTVARRLLDLDDLGWFQQGGCHDLREMASPVDP